MFQGELCFQLVGPLKQQASCGAKSWPGEFEVMGEKVGGNSGSLLLAAAKRICAVYVQPGAQPQELGPTIFGGLVAEQGPPR